jgi:hypothetical protein
MNFDNQYLHTSYFEKNRYKIYYMKDFLLVMLKNTIIKIKLDKRQMMEKIYSKQVKLAS